MIDRNSPIKDQLKSAAKNAESIDRTYWAFVFNEAHAHIEELEAQLADANMRAIAADSQAQMAYEAQEELQAQLAEVTAERDDLKNVLAGRDHASASARMVSKALRRVTEADTRAETYRAAIPIAYQMALEAALPLPRPDGASTWTLDPEFVMDVAHAIQTEEGWDTTMEVVELAMLAAERRMMEAKTRCALTPPDDLVEQATQKAKGEV